MTAKCCWYNVWHEAKSKKRKSHGKTSWLNSYSWCMRCVLSSLCHLVSKTSIQRLKNKTVYCCFPMNRFFRCMSNDDTAKTEGSESETERHGGMKEYCLRDIQGVSYLVNFTNCNCTKYSWVIGKDIIIHFISVINFQAQNKICVLE